MNRIPSFAAAVAAFALVAIVPAAGHAQTPVADPPDTAWTPQDRPVLDVRAAPGPIEIDGVLDDAGWEGAARATGFAENYPDIRARPPVPGLPSSPPGAG